MGPTKQQIFESLNEEDPRSYSRMHDEEDIFSKLSREERRKLERQQKKNRIKKQ